MGENISNLCFSRTIWKWNYF